MHLGTMEVNSMQNGEPLTLVVDDEPVTVGIDLHDKTGIRFCSGDSQKWKRTAQTRVGQSTLSACTAAG